MKTLLFGLAITAAFTACSNNKGESNDTAIKTTDNSKTITPVVAAEPISADGVLAAYLDVKNALANDKSKDAATAAGTVIVALQKIDGSLLNAEQGKSYNEIKDDITEHAEHISTNGGNLAHQREHFDLLSRDIYDLIKMVPTERVLYKDHCPMFNGKKGAIWLSEYKEIKNPYYGNDMLTCGTMQEEIKPGK